MIEIVVLDGVGDVGAVQWGSDEEGLEIDLIEIDRTHQGQGLGASVMRDFSAERRRRDAACD